MKQFVKALDKESAAFEYLTQKFPQLSEAKIKEGIFVGPQIRQLITDNQFEEKMNDLQLTAWKAFRAICTQFLGNHRSPDYMDLAQQLLNSYEALGCKMSLKLQFLIHTWTFSPKILAV